MGGGRLDIRSTKQASGRSPRRYSANASTDALSGDEIEAEVANVVAFLTARAREILVISGPKSRPTSVGACIMFVWPNGIEDLPGRFSFNSECNLLVVRLGRNGISKSAPYSQYEAFSDLYGSRLSLATATGGI